MIVAVLLLILALAPEAAYFIGYLLCDKPDFTGDCRVLVLGFPTRKDGSPHRIQRRRMEAAAEIFRRCACERMILAGGASHTPFVEADTMAKLAAEAGIPESALILERSSRDTKENIRKAIPLLGAIRRVILVSDPLHVHRAKRLFRREKPGTTPELYMVTRYRPFESYGLKWLGALNELYQAFHY